MREMLEQLAALAAKVAEVQQILNIPQKQQRLLELQEQSSQTDFWKNEQEASAVMREITTLQEQIAFWSQLATDVDETQQLVQIATEGKDHAGLADLAKAITALQEKFASREFEVLLSEKYDSNDAIIAIHSGTGGVDAQDWAEILLRMYLRYAEEKNFKTALMDISRGEEAGIKTAVVEVQGAYAYGNLKSENGVHRLVRQSPFSADQLRHTSFALVEVLPVVDHLDDIVINPIDLKIDTYRASGAGGQHVNKTDSAVRITHLPTKIVVTSQSERSQQQNRASAMKLLMAKLYQRKLEEEQAEKQKIRGEYSEAAWGNQIRSYVLHPYKMVKDHRTEHVENNAQAVLDGKLQGLIEQYLRWDAARRHKK